MEALDGPVLVLAGAGTGKTRVLTTRLAHLLTTGGAKPWSVLAVTFTNKAAREMRERVEKLLGPGGGGLPWLGTFHSISARMLRTHAELVGLKNNFSILDTDDQVRLLKQIIDAEGIDEKRWPGRQLAGVIDGWKNRALTPEKVPKNEAFHFADGAGVKLYAQYQARLKILNACDFGDLLMHMIDIFQSHPDVLETYHRKLSHLMVDEYQDTNVAQYLWLRLLAQARKNLCVVGDDDQSIYGWRGAEVDNILRFEHDFPGAQVVRLERNYRSTGHILAVAAHLIANNRGRLGKTLFTDDELGNRVKVRGVWDGEAEARLIADDIEGWRQSNRSYAECAVLVRAAWQMRAFEERFLMLRIPYKVIGGPRFFERAEVRDVHAYLRLIRSEDDDLAFERIVNQPKRGVGDTTIQKLHVAARAANTTYLTRVADMEIADEASKARRRPACAASRSISNAGAPSLSANEPQHPRLLEIILEESGYTDMLQPDKSPQTQTPPRQPEGTRPRRSAVRHARAFLEHVELVMDNAEGDDARTRCRSSRCTPPRASNGRWCSCPAGRRRSFPPAARSTKAAPKASRKNAASPMSASPAPASALHLLRRQPPDLRPLDQRAAPPLRRRTPRATRRCRQRDRLRLAAAAASTAPKRAPAMRTTPAAISAMTRAPARNSDRRLPQKTPSSGGYDSPAGSVRRPPPHRGKPRPPDIEGRAFRAEDSDGRPLQRGRTPGDMLASSDPSASRRPPSTNASSTKNSATAASPPSKAPSSPSTSTRPA